MRSSTCGQIDGALRLAGRGPADRRRSTSPSSVMSSTGTTTSSSTVLADGGCTTSTSRGAAEERGDLVDAAARSPTARSAAPGASSSASRRSRRQREVRAALGAGDGVHLVDDHRLDAAQRLAGRRGEQQEQRLGRGDQDVGRRAWRTGGARRRGCRRCACRP